MSKEFAQTILQILENAPNVDLITRYFEWQLITNDPDDNKFVDCAIASNAVAILTHDKHFNILKETDFPKIAVWTVDEFKKHIQDNIH